MSDSFILPVDKPVGPTSHDIVRDARRALGVRRIGHTGTLDPFASGLLLLCVGQATRLAELLVDLPKRYRARMRLGVRTDTDDLTGSVLEEMDASAVDPDRVREALAAQVGVRLQRPPAYSAKKVAGRRAYDRARAGEQVDLEPVEVRIDAIHLLSIDGPEVEFDVLCGKGVFIRAIARDVGTALGLGGHLTALRRTEVGHFHVDAAAPADQLTTEVLERAKVTPARALMALPSWTVGEADAAKVRNGIRIPCDLEVDEEGPVTVLSEAGDLIAIAQVRNGVLQPRKVIG